MRMNPSTGSASLQQLLEPTRTAVLVYGLDEGSPRLGGVFPTLQVLPDDWDEAEDCGDTEANLADKVAMLAAKEALASQQTAKYFVTISQRTAMRRLHMSGCFVRPDRCCEVVFMDEVSPDSFESICQACKKRMMADCGKDPPELSSSTSSSSSTASALKLTVRQAHRQTDRQTDRQTYRQAGRQTDR